MFPFIIRKVIVMLIPIAVMRTDVGVICDDTGNISFHLLNDDGNVIGIGTFVAEVEDNLVKEFNVRAKAMKDMGLGVFIIPESERIKLVYICSNCGNDITVPNRIFSAEIIESQVDCEIDVISMWSQILNSVVRCCNDPEYSADNREKKKRIKVE